MGAVPGVDALVEQELHHPHLLVGGRQVQRGVRVNILEASSSVKEPYDMSFFLHSLVAFYEEEMLPAMTRSRFAISEIITMFY